MLQINFEKRFCKNCVKCDKQIHKYRFGIGKGEETEATIKSSDCIVAVVSGDDGGADDGHWHRVVRRGEQAYRAEVNNQTEKTRSMLFIENVIVCCVAYYLLGFVLDVGKQF